MKSSIVFLLALAGFLFFPIPGIDAQPDDPPTLADALAEDTSTTLFVSALRAADLFELLRTEPELEVVAPTDAAFAALPEGVLDALLRPDNVEQLRSVLRYHLLSGPETGDLLAEQTTDSGANLSEPREYANGRLRYSDRVLLPPELKISDL